MNGTKNLLAMSLFVAAVLALSACNRRTIYKGAEGAAPPAINVGVTDPTPTAIEGSWRSGCLPGLNRIDTMVVSGNLMTYTSSPCGGQPAAPGRSNFTLGDVDESNAPVYQYPITYTSGTWEGSGETMYLDTTTWTVSFSSQPEAVLQYSN